METVAASETGTPKHVQQQVEEHETAQPEKFGSLTGAFTPCLLTIFGVIMFLGEGWVFGSAALGGAFLIILLSFAIIATALSMSTFVANIRVGYLWAVETSRLQTLSYKKKGGRYAGTRTAHDRAPPH